MFMHLRLKDWTFWSYFFYSSFCLNSCPCQVLFDYSHYTPRWHLPEAMLPSLRLGPANTLNTLIIWWIKMIEWEMVLWIVEIQEFSLSGLFYSFAECITSQRQMQRAIMIFKFLSGFAPGYLIELLAKRFEITEDISRNSMSKLAVPIHCTAYLKNSWGCSDVLVWNSLSSSWDKQNHPLIFAII